MLENLKIPLIELRSLVLEVLKEKTSTQYLEICNDVAALAVEKGIARNPSGNRIIIGGSFSLQRQDQDRVREIIWDLIIERVLTIGIDSSNETWPWVSLTDYGNKVVNSSTPTPHDPSGYLDRIKKEIPNINPIIINYLEESLNTYNINALLSSTISLGCASEKALLLLIESYKNAIQDTGRKTKFINNIENRTIKRQFDEFSKCITNLIGKMPPDISDGLNNVLLGVFEMIRNNRNDSGHPTGKSISKDHAYANLQVFIPYCKKIYQLIDHFNSYPVV